MVRVPTHPTHVLLVELDAYDPNDRVLDQSRESGELDSGVDGVYDMLLSSPLRDHNCIEPLIPKFSD